MENIKQIIQQLAGKWNLTNHDNPFILTPQEERDAIDYAIKKAKDHYINRFSRWLPLKEIELKMADMDWNQIANVEEAVIRANNAKNYQAWQEQQKREKDERELEEQFKMQQNWTAKTFFNLMRAVSNDFYKTPLIVNDETLPLIRTICFFLSEDERFESELNFDFSKGLWIRGICGLGKTYLLKCVENNPLNPLVIYSMVKISESVKRNGMFDLPYTERITCLDDVGTEEATVNNFGTRIHWFKEFFELYYSQSRPFNRLIVSTNESFDSIESKYGFRVRSRIKDMFNVVDVKGTDLRGTKK